MYSFYVSVKFFKNLKDKNIPWKNKRKLAKVSPNTHSTM